jgi:hypothetical protein
MDNADVIEISGSAKDKYVESRNAKNSETSSFMFVNESSAAPTYKSGNRRDVRAHVRKVVSKQFGLTHKKPKQRAERLPKYAPLKTKVADPTTAPLANHHRDCPKHALAIHKASFSTSRTLIEITESRSKTISRTVITEISDATGAHAPSASYCPACGQPLNLLGNRQIRANKESKSVAFSAQRQKSNLIGFLGAGRVDPFSSLPMDETDKFSQELLDHGKYDSNTPYF